MQPIDRDRLRATLVSAAASLGDLADQAIASKIPQLVPPQLRPLLPGMMGRLQIRSTISDAVTRATSELSDDEWRSLLQLVKAEISMLAPEEGEDDVIRSLRTGTLAAARHGATEAIAHLRVILTD